MRDATENESRSCLDHVWILRNCSSLRVRHSALATRDARTEVHIASPRLMNAHASMLRPHLTTTSVASPTWRW